MKRYHGCRALLTGAMALLGTSAVCHAARVQIMVNNSTAHKVMVRTTQDPDGKEIDAMAQWAVTIDNSTAGRMVILPSPPQLGPDSSTMAIEWGPNGTQPYVTDLSSYGPDWIHLTSLGSPNSYQLDILEDSNAVQQMPFFAPDLISHAGGVWEAYTGFNGQMYLQRGDTRSNPVSYSLVGKTPYVPALLRPNVLEADAQNLEAFFADSTLTSVSSIRFPADATTQEDDKTGNIAGTSTVRLVGNYADGGDVGPFRLFPTSDEGGVLLVEHPATPRGNYLNVAAFRWEDRPASGGEWHPNMQFSLRLPWGKTWSDFDPQPACTFLVNTVNPSARRTNRLVVALLEPRPLSNPQYPHIWIGKQTITHYNNGNYTISGDPVTWTEIVSFGRRKAGIPVDAPPIPTRLSPPTSARTGRLICPTSHRQTATTTSGNPLSCAGMSSRRATTPTSFGGRPSTRR